VPTYEPPSAEVLSWVVECCGAGADVVATERLVGGITASVDRFVVRGGDGQDQRLVLRRWASVEPWTDRLVEREAQALAALEGQGVGAPRLVAADPAGDRAGVRCVLMTEVPGEVVLAPDDLDGWIDGLARTQARIHAVTPTLTTKSGGWFLPDADYGWIADGGVRRDALAAASGDAAVQASVLVHGDYQHFNVLWDRGEVSGVVDWPMAGIGRRGFDVGHCRLNLAVLFSTASAELYLDRYEEASGFVVDSRSDLRALLVWDPSWLGFIPLQVAGRATVDLNGMAERVTNTIRQSLARMG
jgi:aminoglycoside phosphotransferase (APT) family kinase protein